MHIGYSKFLKICSTKKTKKTFGGFRVKKDGLYVILPDKKIPLTPYERSILSWHPTGYYKEPALHFPCTLEQLRSFVADAGLLGCINEYVVDEMMESESWVCKSEMHRRLHMMFIHEMTFRIIHGSHNGKKDGVHSHANFLRVFIAEIDASYCLDNQIE